MDLTEEQKVFARNEERKVLAMMALGAQIIGCYSFDGGAALRKAATDTNRTVAQCLAAGARQYADAMLDELDKVEAASA